MAHEIILTISHEAPPSAEDLGELFSSLARDYRDMTKGRVLIISKIESGSIITILADYAQVALPYVKDTIEVAKGIKAISDFCKVLAEWTGKAKSGAAKKQLYRQRGRKPAGQRSIEAILKIAANSNSAVHIKQINAKGESIEVHMGPAEAIHIRNDAIAEQDNVAKVVKAETEFLKTPPSVERIVSELTNGRLAHMSSKEIPTIAHSLASVLKNTGLSYLAPQIASDLEMRGHHEFAAVFRDEFPPEKQKNTEPPLLT